MCSDYNNKNKQSLVASNNNCMRLKIRLLHLNRIKSYGLLELVIYNGI